MKILSKSLEETREAADNILNTLEKGERATIIALKGDLGAGKTAFTKEVGKILGVEEDISSPTFVIQKIYSIDWKPARQSGGVGFAKLVHIDAYRLEQSSELITLGWEELIKNPENLIFLEWPERVEDILPEGTKLVELKFIDESVREITHA